MSSAALQTPTGLPTSTRHYASSHSPTSEGYYATQQQPQPQVSTASSTSSSRPSRKSSAGGQSNPNTNSNNGGAYPNSPAHLSQSNSPMTSRAAFSSPVVPSAAVTAAAATMSDYPQPSPATSERRRHVPPVAPPRTSSNRHEQQASMSNVPPSSSSSRRSAAITAATGAPTSATDSPRRHRESRGTSGAAGSGFASREESSRRRQQQGQPIPQEYVQRSATGSSRATTGSMPIRTHATSSSAAPSSRGPSRENSEILSAMVVSRDEVDVEREKTRLAMAHVDQSADADGNEDDAVPPPIAPASALQEQPEDSRRGGRSRHDYSKREKQIKFGEYILGNTIGEGEFGKVKLGWKQEGGVQVAIKLIKKDTIGNNPTRMAKIMREVNILRQLNHPNIVQLHKMEESEHHYGIVLEYASGGELFDYILKHRYLKDPAARRLFAQLISGVGYLHKKGIVHRDLKLENLLLDRNRNIIITDFGFANTFDPTEDLTEDEEANLADREWVKRMGFDRVKPNGMRKADLMQTSCGSPCYAAPELVVSDSLYTGCKVDVWSCGVILYAMLAGYLPFDDDPKNPEGDNINLLYKYIVNTPLTFPEYVTPHARDLLRRILVPNPRERADLFEVARHSWLSEYANIVEFITSSTTSPGDIQNIPVTAEESSDGPIIGRSASVRESSKKAAAPPTIGGLTSKQGNIDPEAEAAYLKHQKENKRRTVQVEYVAPATQTHRGEVLGQTGANATGKTRARSSHGPVAVAPPTTAAANKPLPKDPPASKPQRDSRRPPSAHRMTGASTTMAATAAGVTSSRSNRDVSRSAQETAYIPTGSGGRPVTGGSMASTGSRAAANRASFGQPVPPTVAGTNVHGRIQQPKGSSSRNYVISNPIPQDATSIGRPSISVAPKFAQASGFAGNAGDQSGNGSSHGSSHGSRHGAETKGHRRSNTLGDITDKLLGRSGSLFGGKGRKRSEQRQSVGVEKLSRRYPPVSMSNAVASMQGVSGDEPRASMDSTARQPRRSFSIGLGKKRSGSVDGSQTSQEKKQHSRRFSLLPGPLSFKAIGINKDYTQSSDPESQVDLPIQDPPHAARVGTAGQHVDSEGYRDVYSPVSAQHQVAAAASSPAATQHHLHSQHLQEQQLAQQQQQQASQQQQQYVASGERERHRLSVFPTQSQTQTGVLHEVTDNVQRNPPMSAPYHVDEFQAQDPRRATSRSGRVVLQKNKRLVDAYDTDEYAKHHDRSGSSGAARRVMDFFRRRSKARGGED